MKGIQPHQPSQVSPYARACLEALVKANLADRIALGEALGLFHYLDYRPTHDVDAWWSEALAEAQKQEVTRTLEQIADPGQHEQAQDLRNWYLSSFLAGEE